jgi:high-affinity nickel-transport protein
MKFGFTCRAALTGLGDSQHRLTYEDGNFPGRAGWKELIVNADARFHLVGSAADVDRSGELSNYPTDLLNSPPQNLTATVGFTTEGHANVRKARNRRPMFMAARARRLSNKAGSFAPIAVAPLPRDSDAGSRSLRANVRGTPHSAFTELISQQHLSLWFLLTAAMVSMALGALHALEPGHGKTLVAAYLVGARGTAAHAALLGAVVTLAHTSSVYLLGGITLYASRYILPEKLYPWLAAGSGTIIASLGLLLFLRRWASEETLLAENHTHWFERLIALPSLKTATSDESASRAKQQVSIRQLLVLGITGGVVPCPAALVVLLSAFALHRILFGLFLIMAFSVGLAAVLIGVGLLMVYAGKFISRLSPDNQIVRRHLPLLSAGLISVIGLALVAQSARSAGLVPHFNVSASPKWLLIAGIGLLLGMRHSTDPDHVIAVTTIVARLGSLRQASLVGMLWGIGHTLTIFIVGSAIILFGLVIPPRIGLSMEFAVALMLILLGILNLTGVLARMTRRFSREQIPTEGAVDQGLSPFGTYQLLRPLVIGTVHGLAGSAAVALLVLATIHNPMWAIGYLLLFGLGTVAGMMLMTSIISLPIVWTGNSFVRLNRLMCATSGIVSVAFGLFLVYQIGFVSGLFSAAPKWIPG